MPVCHVDPGDKKKLVDDVGRELVRAHGKQKYYKPAEVKAAATRAGYPIDWHCWAMCVFSDLPDFTAFHQAAGEVCDYAAMRSQVLADLSPAGSFLPFDLDVSWLEWPDIDLSSLFDWF